MYTTGVLALDFWDTDPGIFFTYTITDIHSIAVLRRDGITIPSCLLFFGVEYFIFQTNRIPGHNTKIFHSSRFTLWAVAWCTLYNGTVVELH